MRHRLLPVVLLFAIFGCEQESDSADADEPNIYTLGETITDYDGCVSDCKSSDVSGCAPACRSLFPTAGSCSVSNPGMQ